MSYEYISLALTDLFFEQRDNEYCPRFDSNLSNLKDNNYDCHHVHILNVHILNVHFLTTEISVSGWRIG